MVLYFVIDFTQEIPRSIKCYVTYALKWSYNYFNIHVYYLPNVIKPHLTFYHSSIFVYFYLLFSKFLVYIYSYIICLAIFNSHKLFFLVIVCFYYYSFSGWLLLSYMPSAYMHAALTSFFRVAPEYTPIVCTSMILLDYFISRYTWIITNTSTLQITKIYFSFTYIFFNYEYFYRLSKDEILLGVN